MLLVEQKQLREVRKRAFDDITICRRAAEEALSALAQHFPDLDRVELEERLQDLQERTPSGSTGTLPADLLEAWQPLRTAAEEAFYQAGNAGIRFRHKETNNGSPSESCNKGFPKKAEAVLQNERTPEHLSPELILEACPTLADYGKPIRDLADIVAAGRYLRASLGAHESAWTEAVAEIGLVKAAVAVIYVLQLHEDDVEKGGEPDQEPGRLLPGPGAHGQSRQNRPRRRTPRHAEAKNVVRGGGSCVLRQLACRRAEFLVGRVGRFSSLITG